MSQDRSPPPRHDDADHQASLTALAASIPGVVFRLELQPDGQLRFVHASEASNMLLGLTPEALREDAGRFLTLLLDADRQSFEQALHASAANAAPLNWEGRILASEGDIKWINLRATISPGQAARPRWEGVMWNITQSKRAEQELRKSRAQLADFSAHLEQAKEAERERIARDIHDELGGHLVAMKIEASLLAGRIARQGDELRERLRAMEKLIDEAIDTVSRVTRELRPGILKDFGLAAALECQGEDFAARTGISFRLDCADPEIAPRDELSIALFRIFQEALTNVAKHAAARQVEAGLEADAQSVRLRIDDDGTGVTAADLDKPRSFGLRGIRERIERLGGHFTISTRPAGGTRLTIEAPLSHASHHEDTP